ncbi:hypothetical protein GCM10009776_25840 [Microbacterium deminutum]|uniref:Uncharacterized protein n=1 Tax=Microbacterium deminutum TaxID=344164 RepID=A0ABN2R1P3_9MICO
MKIQMHATAMYTQNVHTRKSQILMSKCLFVRADARSPPLMGANVSATLVPRHHADRVMSVIPAAAYRIVSLRACWLAVPAAWWPLRTATRLHA